MGYNDAFREDVFDKHLNTKSISSMNNQQITDMELGNLIQCTIGKNPETIYIALETDDPDNLELIKTLFSD